MANEVNQSALKRKIKSWLRVALEGENLESFAVELVGNADKGDGYIGDIMFVHVTGKTATGSAKDYDLVLKCAKQSAALRENAPIKKIYENEICMYTTVFPALKTFQENSGLEDIFDNVPEFYGIYIGRDIEVVVLNDLTKIGYELYDRRKPLTTRHMHLVLKEYGRWHATAAAFLDQHPKEFQVATGGLVDLWIQFKDSNKVYAYTVGQVTRLMEDEFDEVTRLRWKNLGDNIDATLQLHAEAIEGFTVISHGDCWNNNFMYKNDQNGLPSKVVMLDWQFCKVSNPVFDLSYFLYACVSEEDLKDFDGLLRVYHDSLSSHLEKLGSSPDLYPYSQLQKDWKRLGRTGIAQSTIALKISLIDSEDVPDAADIVEQGLEYVDTFKMGISDPKAMKCRMKYIIAHAVERNYI